MSILPSSGLYQNDAMLDAGISQGIGTSGLVSQDIQRANIEDNNNLRSALSTSQATMQNEQEQRLAEARIAFGKNQSQLLGSMLSNGAARNSGRASTPGAGTPAFVLQLNSGYDSVLDNAPGSGSFNGAKFQLQGANGQYHEFTTPDELHKFLNENPEIAQATVGVSGDRLKRAGANLDLPLIAPGAVNQVLNVQRGSGKLPLEGRQVQAPNFDQYVDSGGKINFSKVPVEAQAKLIDGGFSAVNSMAGAIRNPSNVMDFNSMNESEQIIQAIAGEKNLARKSQMTKYVIEQGIIDPRRRGY